MVTPVVALFIAIHPWGPLLELPYSRPGVDLFMARRFLRTTLPPPFLHCYGHSKYPMQQYAGKFTTLPYALWGRDGHLPMWATKNRDGLKQWQLTPGVGIDFSKLGISPAVGSPEWHECVAYVPPLHSTLTPKPLKIF